MQELAPPFCWIIVFLTWRQRGREVVNNGHFIHGDGWCITCAGRWRFVVFSAGLYLEGCYLTRWLNLAYWLQLFTNWHWMKPTESTLQFLDSSWEQLHARRRYKKLVSTNDEANRLKAVMTVEKDVPMPVYMWLKTVGTQQSKLCAVDKMSPMLFVYCVQLPSIFLSCYVYVWLFMSTTLIV